MKKIDKVGGIILRGKKLLVVRKRTKDNREEYIIPGGKREGNETDFETLKRELLEEIQVELFEMRPFGGFEVYFAETRGEPKCDSEIKDLVWIDKNYTTEGIKLGSVLGKFVIPKLVDMGLM